MKTLADIGSLVQTQPYILRLLSAVAQLGLSDCWIGAGLIRGAVWDHLHGFDPQLPPGSDVDVIYFDAADASLQRDIAVEEELQALEPGAPWSVHNQARMHTRNGDRPYRDVEDAMWHWVETSTAIAARLTDGRVEMLASHGVEDLVQMLVRPTPHYVHRPEIYRARLADKNWQQRWPKLQVRSE